MSEKEINPYTILLLMLLMFLSGWLFGLASAIKPSKVMQRFMGITDAYHGYSGPGDAPHE